MKTIGLIDRYLSEWHANHYPEWIRTAARELGMDAAVCYAWAEREVSPRDGVSTGEWCRNAGVEECRSIGELCEKSDAVMILAPSDPETHLAYAKAVLPYGKPTFIDKTFAQNLAEAREIFRLASAAGTPVFSTSALRCASELQNVGPFERLTITAGGSNLPEYIVHPLEMAVVLLGEPAEVTRTEAQSEGEFHAVLRGNSGRQVTIAYRSDLRYTLRVDRPAGDGQSIAVRSDYFGELMKMILRFFETGAAPFPPEQTLEIMRLRDAILGAAHE